MQSKNNEINAEQVRSTRPWKRRGTRTRGTGIGTDWDYGPMSFHPSYNINNFDYTNRLNAKGIIVKVNHS